MLWILFKHYIIFKEILILRKISIFFYIITISVLFITLCRSIRFFYIVSFLSMQRNFFNISWSKNLLEMNHLSFCISEEVFISFVLLKYISAGYRVPCWHFVFSSLSTLKMLLYYLLGYNISDIKYLSSLSLFLCT